MEKLMRSIAICFCALALSATPASGQESRPSAAPGSAAGSVGAEAQSAPVQPVTQGTPAGPTVEAAAVGIRPRTSGNETATAAQIFRRGQGQDVALMVVGVGAMLVGAIVGKTAGTVILIGGAAMALFGLYNYLE